MPNDMDADAASKLLRVVAELLRGTRHSRRSVAAATGKSLTTADRWIEQIKKLLPDIRAIREGRTSLIAYEGRRDTPSKTATIGACVAASFASVFQGSQHERNLKDARDFMLRAR